MLIVLIHNDGTGTDLRANYDVEVRINDHTVWRSKVDGHNRAAGWPALLNQIAAVAQSPRGRR